MTDIDGARRLAELEAGAWALAAYISTEREAAASSLSEALTAEPARTSVLQAAGLVPTPRTAADPSGALHDGPAADSAASARTSSLGQAMAVASGTTPGRWADQPEEVLLDQGAASATTGRAIALALVPELPGLQRRLAATGSRVLDVGTGVGALAFALAGELPAIRVTGIDVLERAVGLAERELVRTGLAGGRVELRRQDVADLDEVGVYELAWVPAPFLTDTSLRRGMARVVRALRPGGWVVVGTNPVPEGELAAAVAAWQAARQGGSTSRSTDIAPLLRELGLRGVHERPTVPGGPVLVVGRVAEP